MALDPSIPLSAFTGLPDIGQKFSNALLNVQRGADIARAREQEPVRNRLLEAQTGTAEATQGITEQKNKILSLATFAQDIAGDLQAGNLQNIRAKIVNRISQQLPSQGLPSTESQDLLTNVIDNPNLTDEQKLAEVNRLSTNINQLAVQAGVLKARSSTGLASAKTEILDDGTTIQALPTGETQVRNPLGQVVTGQERLDVLKRSQQFRITQQEEEAGVAIDKAQRIAAATQRESRISSIKKDLSTRNRDAAREQIRLNQALTVAATAEQGVRGAAKLKLAKLIPSIDVTNEALLDQGLLQLTLDQLQKFKGPTTDFEFGRAQATVGSVGDSRSGNIARLKSLQRATWFNRREFEQFKRHTKAGGEPDSFSFNFGEPIQTKKGVFTLKDIQDTAVNNNLSIEDTIKRLNQ